MVKQEPKYFLAIDPVKERIKEEERQLRENVRKSHKQKEKQYKHAIDEFYKTQDMFAKSGKQLLDI